MTRGGLVLADTAVSKGSAAYCRGGRLFLGVISVRRFCWVLGMLLVFCQALGSASLATTLNNPQVLILNSYHPGFAWSDKGVGTGLGLAVAHGIVQKHSGAITVESAPGKGSEFTLYFPTIQQEEVWEAQIQEEIPTGREHILLIDDEQVLVDMGRQMLECLGYRVETRMSSMDALALFRDHPQRYDLVITDMTMPNMTGDKLALELMRIRPDIPIMLCTGYGESILEERAKAMGIRAFIMKPILMAQMARAIRKALDKQQGAETAPVMKR